MFLGYLQTVRGFVYPYRRLPRQCYTVLFVGAPLLIGNWPKRDSIKSEDASTFRVSEWSKLNCQTSLLYIDWFALFGTSDNSFS